MSQDRCFLPLTRSRHNSLTPITPACHSLSRSATGVQALLAAIAGKPPGAFPQNGLRLDYGDDLIADPALDAVVAGLLEPMVDDRMRAREALGILEGKLAVGRCAGLSCYRAAFHLVGVAH